MYLAEKEKGTKLVEWFMKYLYILLPDAVCGQTEEQTKFWSCLLSTFSYSK